MRPRLFIFCGIPGSGKTSIASLVTKAMGDAIHIQTDGVRGMLARPTFAGKESQFVYEASFALAREALKSGYSVVIDGTFMREDYRKKARLALRKHYSRADTVFVSCGLDTALRRNSSRDATVPPEKVRGMFLRFEVPRRALKVDSSRGSPESAARRVVRALL
ncbi:MAG: AAA family ATPase [Nitrososphaerales archaeon]|nr:AAA family ATPase [Nitrososphaerales archaeon]